MKTASLTRREFLAGSTAGAFSSLSQVRQFAVTAQKNLRFEGQMISILVPDLRFRRTIQEIRAEFEAETGAQVTLAFEPVESATTKLTTNVSSGKGMFDGAIVPMWSLGDLVLGRYIRAIDDLYVERSGDFPVWDANDELPAIRSLRTFNGNRYVIPFDCDGQVLFYRRDLLEDTSHAARYRDSTGKELVAPSTWDQLYAIAKYFQGAGIDGIATALKAGGQSMFNYLSLAAPYVLGSQNPRNFWFDPETMDPLVGSRGHAAAAEMVKKLGDLAPENSLNWTLPDAVNHFLQGKSVFTFGWSDVLLLSIEQRSSVNGHIGTAQLPGTLAYQDPLTSTLIETITPNVVGNSTGGSWGGVIMESSPNHEAVYYFLSMLATGGRQRKFAVNVSDGINPGRFSQIPRESAPDGTGDLRDFVDHGFTPQGARDYTAAYYQTFSNPLQLPYLRIPGALEYLTALDIRLSEFVTGESGSALVAMSNLADDFRAITQLHGLDQQLDMYNASLDLESA